MLWWILLGVAAVGILALWLVAVRWLDLGSRADRAAHDPERAAALRDALRQAEQGREWGGYGH